MNHKTLLFCCIETLDSFNPAIDGVQEHLTSCLGKRKDLQAGDESFITEVFSGCVQHYSILKAVIDAYYVEAGKTCLRVDRNLYTVLAYLALYRLDELGVVHFKKFIAPHETSKMYKFLSFLFNEDNITTWMKHECCKHYEQSYVQTTLISPLMRWLPELHDLVAKLQDKLANKQKPRQAKGPTEPKPFNLTKPRPRSVPVPEPIPKLKPLRPFLRSFEKYIKAQDGVFHRTSNTEKKAINTKLSGLFSAQAVVEDIQRQLHVSSTVPHSTYRLPVEEDTLLKIREENRKKAEDIHVAAESKLLQDTQEIGIIKRIDKGELIKSSARQPACASAEKSEKTKRRMRQIIEEENAKLQFEKVKAREMPSTISGNIPIKLNAATIMREGVLFQRKEEHELKRLAEYEKGGRDASEFLKWQENARKRDEDEKLADIERRRLEGKLSYEEAILARQSMIKQNQQRVSEMKEETREMMENYLEKKSKEGQEMRKLVEQTMMEHENTKEARKQLQEYKQKLVQQVGKESQEMMRKALEEAEEEMRQRVALIAKIRAIESVPVIRFKHVDLTQTSGAGLLSEMSVAELRERLALLKVAQREDEEERRDNILKSKVDKDQLLMDTLETIAKHRAEKGNDAAIRLEERRRQKKPDIKDPKLTQLQEKLEARKAERRKEGEKLAVVPKNSSAKRQKALQAQKASLEKLRWKELEETREKAAKLRGDGLASRNSAGVRPVTNLRNLPVPAKVKT